MNNHNRRNDIHIPGCLLNKSTAIITKYDKLFKQAKRINPAMELIGKGKAKDIYLADSGDIIFEFTDRVTAFDGAKKAEYPHKGEVCCSLAAYWFKILKKESVPTHFKEKIGANRMKVAKLDILQHILRFSIE